MRGLRREEGRAAPQGVMEPMSWLQTLREVVERGGVEVTPGDCHLPGLRVVADGATRLSPMPVCPSMSIKPVSVFMGAQRRPNWTDPIPVVRKEALGQGWCRVKDKGGDSVPPRVCGAVLGAQ